MDLINENIWYVAEGEDEILQIPSPWLTMTLQARLAWGASTNCLRPELNWIFKKLLNDNCIHVDPQNFLWVNIEIIDPLVPKDISRRGGLRSLPFSNRWVSYRKWRLREGGGKENQLFIIKCFRGWALVFAGEAGFPALRRLNNREQRTDNSRQIGARNVTFQKSSHFSKFSETVTAILLTKIDESSKLLRCVPRGDGHPVEVLEMSLFNRLGRRTNRRADGTRSSNC